MEKVMALLVICSVMTALVTEGIKQLVPEGKQYSKNILAAVVSVCVGVAVGAGYLALNHISFGPEVVIYGAALVVLSWLAATVGYDKVVQTISQIKNKLKKDGR